MKKIICIYCRSTKIVKRGFRHNEKEKKQLFLCNKCGKKFTPGFTKYRHPEKIILHAVHLHKKMSLTEVQRELRKRNVFVSRWTISKWSKKF